MVAKSLPVAVAAIEEDEHVVQPPRQLQSPAVVHPRMGERHLRDRLEQNAHDGRQLDAATLGVRRREPFCGRFRERHPRAVSREKIKDSCSTEQISQVLSLDLAARLQGG